MDSQQRQTQFNDLRSLAHEQMRRGEFVAAKPVLADMLSIEPHALEALCDLAACYYTTYQFDEFKALTEKAYLLLSKFGVLPFEQDRASSIVLKLGNLLEETGAIDKTFKVHKMPYKIVSEEDQLKHVRILSQKLRLACDFERKNEIIAFSQQLEIIPLKGQRSDVDRFHALIKADGFLVGPAMAIQRCLYILENHLYLAEPMKQWFSFDLIFDLLRLKKLTPEVCDILQRFQYEDLGPFEKIVWDLYFVYTQKNQKAVFDTSKLVGLNLMSSIKIIDAFLSLEVYLNQREELYNKFKMLLNGLSQDARKALLPLLKTPLDSQDENQDLEISLSKNETLICEIFKKMQTESLEIEQMCQVLYDGTADLHAIGRLKVSITRLNKKLFNQTGKAQTFIFRDGFLVLTQKLAEKTNRKIS